MCQVIPTDRNVSDQISTYQATVKVSAHDKPILLKGMLAMNRCLDGDVVAIEILPTASWSVASDLLATSDTSKDPAHSLDTSADSGVVRQLSGRVVGVIKRNWRSYVPLASRDHWV